MGQNTLIELSNTLSALLQGLCMNILHCILYIVMHICRNENMFFVQWLEQSSVWNGVGFHNSSALFWLRLGSAVQKETRYSTKFQSSVSLWDVYDK